MVKRFRSKVLLLSAIGAMTIALGGGSCGGGSQAGLAGQQGPVGPAGPSGPSGQPGVADEEEVAVTLSTEKYNPDTPEGIAACATLEFRIRPLDEHMRASDPPVGRSIRVEDACRISGKFFRKSGDTSSATYLVEIAEVGTPFNNDLGYDLDITDSDGTGVGEDALFAALVPGASGPLAQVVNCDRIDHVSTFLARYYASAAHRLANWDVTQLGASEYCANLENIRNEGDVEDDLEDDALDPATIPALFEESPEHLTSMRSSYCIASSAPGEGNINEDDELEGDEALGDDPAEDGEITVDADDGTITDIHALGITVGAQVVLTVDDVETTEEFAATEGVFKTTHDETEGVTSLQEDIFTDLHARLSFIALTDGSQDDESFEFLDAGFNALLHLDNQGEDDSDDDKSVKGDTGIIYGGLGDFSVVRTDRDYFADDVSGNENWVILSDGAGIAVLIGCPNNATSDDADSLKLSYDGDADTVLCGLRKSEKLEAENGDNREDEAYIWSYFLITTDDTAHDFLLKQVHRGVTGGARQQIDPYAFADADAIEALTQVAESRYPEHRHQVRFFADEVGDRLLNGVGVGGPNVFFTPFDSSFPTDVDAETNGDEIEIRVVKADGEENNDVVDSFVLDPVGAKTLVVPNLAVGDRVLWEAVDSNQEGEFTCASEV